MVRVRAEWFDSILRDRLRIARESVSPIHVISIGSGLDARWLRIATRPANLKFTEVEEPDVLDLKSDMIAESRFGDAWADVEKVALTEPEWPGAASDSKSTIVLLEGVSTRLGGRGLRIVLERLRRQVPTADVLCDVPGFLTNPSGSSLGGTSWEPMSMDGPANIRRTELARLGWRVVEERVLVGRPDLRLTYNATRCPGMEPMRLLHLRAA